MAEADNVIGVEGGKAVAEALKTNRSLTQLDLQCEHGRWMAGREGVMRGRERGRGKADGRERRGGRAGR